MTQSWNMARCMVVLVVALVPMLSLAGGRDILENFIQTAQSGRADFSQTVTSPSRNGEPPRIKISSGRFEFSRPGKFKFEYKKPFEQLILADGTHLWIYDADLNQASQRKQASAFANTPAALIAASTDLSPLKREFILTDGPDQDGLSWVVAKPRSPGSSLQLVQIGFRGDALQQLDITDVFGQRSVIRFSSMQVNVALEPSSFRFSLPPQAELIRQ